MRADSQKAQSSFARGLALGEVGNFAGAIQAFQQALALQPNYPEAHYNLGLALLANSEAVPPWKDTLPHFQAAVASRPDYFQARRMAGVAFLETGDPMQAITELKAAISLQPAYAEAHFDLGRALAAAGGSFDPYPEYLIALKLKSPYPDADSALATLLLSRGQTGEAIPHFDAALAVNPDLESARYGLGRALKLEGKLDASKVELKAASQLLQRESDIIQSSHLSNESLDRAKLGENRAAMESAKRAIWLNPANALANFNLGLLLADAGSLDAAIHQIQKAVSLAPFRAHFYIDLSRVQQHAGRQGDAVATLRRAIQIDPQDPAFAAALRETETGALPDAVSRAANKTTTEEEMFPFGAPSNTADGHLAFATHLSGEGDFLGAIGELRRALVSEPARSDLRYHLAVAAIQIGRQQEAEYELRTVLRLTPDSVPAHLALGSLLFEQKDLSSAASELRRVVALQPGNEQALRLLAQCNQGGVRQY